MPNQVCVEFVCRRSDHADHMSGYTSQMVTQHVLLNFILSDHFRFKWICFCSYLNNFKRLMSRNFCKQYIEQQMLHPVDHYLYVLGHLWNYIWSTMLLTGITNDRAEPYSHTLLSECFRHIVVRSKVNDEKIIADIIYPAHSNVIGWNRAIITIFSIMLTEKKNNSLYLVKHQFAIQVCIIAKHNNDNTVDSRYLDFGYLE